MQQHRIKGELRGESGPLICARRDDPAAPDPATSPLFRLRRSGDWIRRLSEDEVLEQWNELLVTAKSTVI